MNTKTKHDLNYYVRRAVDDFKTLVIYFNITRPQYEATFKDGGEFSTKKLTNIAHYLSKGTKGLTKEELHRYNKLSAVYNYTFGIPNELVKKVMGEYVDGTGKHHKIPPTKIIEHLIATGFLDTPINAGKKVKKADDKYKVVCYWHKKYPLKNEKYMFQLMSDKRYSKIETFPNASERVKKIILKWHGEHAPKKTEKNEFKVEKNEATIAKTDIEKKLSRFCEGMRMYVHPSYNKTIDKLSKMYVRLQNEVYETTLKAVKDGDRKILQKMKMMDIDDDIYELIEHFWCRYTKMKAMQKEVA